ncbi:MAG: transporter substrate-binding domain-containing protein [Propionivibrio sp.]|nr:transporter substrate-binding domain-containing protein [Propionivibrio sp.]MBP6712127.1 transporter substrate-binding domain-containing protein [Propionivibrio sp.]MBP7525350.1 transporter substrate-binding domain-containing protein [Propionivibrio sp.]
MKLKSLFPLLAALALTILGSTVVAEEKDKPLIVGMELAYPPFEMTDTSGKPTGVSVDLATDLAKSLGRPVVIQNTAFDGLIPALKTGKVDLVISSMTATAERAQSIDFSEPYISTGLSLLLKKDSTAKGIADLDREGVKVAVKKGTTGHIFATNNLKKAQVLVLDKESAAVLEVSQGKADAFIYDQMSVYQNWQRNKETTQAILEPFQKESWAVGIRKGNDELKAQVNRFIKDYREKGGFEQLGERYLKEMRDEFKRLGSAFFL